MRLPLTLLATLAIGVAEAQPPSEARRLIGLLGSKDYKERERASKDLAALGERALPELNAALQQTESPEVQRRIEVIVDRLKAERLLRPSRVSIDCKGAPFKAVMADLCKQAGYEYRDGGYSASTITLKLADAPFWEAMVKISELTGVTVVPTDDEKRSISAYNNETVNPYNCVSGPFQFTAANINSSRNLQLANLPRRGQLTNPEYLGMNVQILAEPKLPIVGVGQVTVLKAVDDKGSSLVPPPESDDDRRSTRFYVQNNYRSLNQSCGLNLHRGNREATTIKELHAKVALAVLVEVRPEITVENILKAKKQKFAGGDLDMEIAEVTEAAGVVGLKLIFRQRVANPDDYGWSYSIAQRLDLLDDKGNKLVSTGVSEQNNDVGILSIRIGFAAATGQKAGKPAKLILNEWITQTREVEFKFKNIPLP